MEYMCLFHFWFPQGMPLILKKCLKPIAHIHTLLYTSNTMAYNFYIFLSLIWNPLCIVKERLLVVPKFLLFSSCTILAGHKAVLNKNYFPTSLEAWTEDTNEILSCAPRRKGCTFPSPISPFPLTRIWVLLNCVDRKHLMDAAAAKSLQSCPTLCDPTDDSPPGSPVPGILQARTPERVAISFSSAWKWRWKWSRSVVSDS